jgi:phosphoribosylaminoimidazole-succinocarboxamide synthase
MCSREDIVEATGLARTVNGLTDFFADRGVTLVDFKLEFGMTRTV